MKSINPVLTFSVDGVTVNVYRASLGEGLPEHSHQYDHVTACLAGSCRVVKGEKEKVINQQSLPLLLKAPDPHEIAVLEDSTIFINVLGVTRG